MRRVKSEAKYGGLPCNKTISETIPCGTDPCRLGKKVVNCLWGDWGAWGACDKCGGEKRRYRHIEKIPSMEGRLVNTSLPKSSRTALAIVTTVSIVCGAIGPTMVTAPPLAELAIRNVTAP